MAIDGGGVAACIWVAGIWNATVVELTEEASFSHRTLAEEVANSVYASGASFAGCRRAIIDVFAAIVASPAVDADALVAAWFVQASGPILAHVRPTSALIDILAAIWARETLGTLAGVVVCTLNAGSAVLA